MAITRRSLANSSHEQTASKRVKYEISESEDSEFGPDLFPELTAEEERRAREAAKEEANNAVESEEEAQDDFDDEDDISDFVPDEEADEYGDNEDDVDDEDGGVPLEMVMNELSHEDIEEDVDVSETDDAEAETTAPIPLDSTEKEANRKRFHELVIEIVNLLLDIGINADYNPEEAQSFHDLATNYTREFLVKAVIDSVPDEVQVLFGAQKIGGTEYLTRHMPKIPKQCGGVYYILAHRDRPQDPLDEDPIEAVYCGSARDVYHRTSRHRRSINKGSDELRAYKVLQGSDWTINYCLFAATNPSLKESVLLLIESVAIILGKAKDTTYYDGKIHGYVRAVIAEIAMLECLENVVLKIMIALLRGDVGLDGNWNDLEDAFHWLHENMDFIGGESDKVVIGGISADLELVTLEMICDQIQECNQEKFPTIIAV
ncbi:hypothetical protein FQN50_001553 [Emmonsiellopsis sp. PD_5]|nr:hypothetical protein FQN50_001553 [Emmonsiellopsis sp. PD_5]